MSRGDADDALVAQLTEMGFDSDRAATALAVQGNDLQGAIDWCVFSTHPLPCPAPRTLPVSQFIL